MKSFIIISILTLIGCSREKSNDKIPSSLFDTLKEQVVFVTDSSFKQSDDYNLGIARLNFLNLNSAIYNKDSLVLMGKLPQKQYGLKVDKSLTLKL